jgi:O-methyltransferase involved in polyketide biosynthesis
VAYFRARETERPDALFRDPYARTFGRQSRVPDREQPADSNNGDFVNRIGEIRSARWGLRVKYGYGI